MEKMYDNISEKLKKLAKGVGIAGIVVMIVGGILLLLAGLSGLMLIIGGVVTLLSSWGMYGQAQLIGDVRVIRNVCEGNKHMDTEDLPEL